MPVDVALAGVAVSFMCGLLRLARGPSPADRVMAIDLCFFAIVGAFALLSVRLETEAFVDAVLVATLVGFIATVSLGWLVSRR